MTTQTRIQLQLQPDSGSILYQDSEDGAVFHIESMSDTSRLPSPHTSHAAPNGDSSSSSTTTTLAVRAPDNTAGRRDRGREGGSGSGGSKDPAAKAQTDLIKSFLRQHLVKNGEDSRCLVPLMHKDSIEAMLVATVGLHLRKGGGGGGAGGAVGTLHKTLGTLVSVLQQREKALRFVEGDMMRLGCDADGDADGVGNGEEA